MTAHDPAEVVEVTALADGVSVRLQKGNWTQVMPLADLPDFIDLYRRLWSRGARKEGEPGPWASYYADDIRALEAALRRLSAVQGGRS